MKKRFISPQMHIIELETTGTILAGSIFDQNDFGDGTGGINGQDITIDSREMFIGDDWDY